MPPLNKIKFTVPAALAKYVGKDTPREAKLFAAKGTLPIPPKDMVIVLFYLAHYPDPEIKMAAENSLLSIPHPILKTILESNETHPLILDFYAKKLDQESGLLEVIALNKVTHDETIEYLAGIANKTLVEIIANNQTRILRHPKIIDVLGNNPLVGQATIERILHFIALQTGAKPKEAVPPPKPAIQVPPEEQAEEQPQEELPQEEQPQEEIPDYMKDDEYPWMSDEEMPDHWGLVDMPEEFMMDYDRELTDEEKLNLTKKVMKMNVAEKIKMALMGNKEARSILVKDSNKIVANAVLESPKLTDIEIEEISRSRSVSDEIIRKIANNNEWVRNYTVKNNLVNNPKTPIPTAIKFLNFLTKRDLMLVSKSKNVPSPVATAARKLLQKRDAPKE